MTTVNSLSGGKTSSYIAIKYPADIELFAMVCADDHNINASAKSKGILDKSMLDYANAKLSRYATTYGEFVGTPEDPIIIRTMREMEQKMGKEIQWVRGISWEDMIATKDAIPNQFKRFCTTLTKLYPVFEYCFMYTELPVEMRIGYRYDELHRKEDFTDRIDFPFQANSAMRSKIRYNKMKCESYQTSNWLQQWTKDILWRVGSFPLIDDKIFQFHVDQYWSENDDVTFSKDSNCQHCFWKDPQQIRKNWDSNTSIMSWAGIQEVMIDKTYKKEHSIFDISKLGIQMDFLFGSGSGCQAGFCTD